MHTLGKAMIFGGLLLTVSGVLLIYRDKLGIFKYFGRLPGDIYIKKEGFSFYFPFTTGLIISVVLTLLLQVFHWANRGK